MTTATTNRTQLEIADGCDLLHILREQHEMWGAGMSRGDMVEGMRLQMSQPWARRNLRILVMRDKGEIVATAKVYNLEAQARSVDYRIAGIGGVYTMEKHRGRGYGSELLEALERLTRDENFDGMLLFSDIDPSFYEQSDYELLSDHEFHIWTNDPDVERQIMSDRSFVEDLHEHEPEQGLVETTDVPLMVAHHRRYLSTIPFGIKRTDDYWQYQIVREQFIQTHSTDNRPVLEFLSIDLDSPRGGYAIFEHSSKIMRVLEVIGLADAREILWRNLLRTALLRRVHLVRGWESVAPSFMRAPKYIERQFAKPMLRVFNPKLEPWLDVLPCPLLELNHF
jgi:predicted acetyltransferase